MAPGTPPRKHPADLGAEDTVNNKLQTWLWQIWGDPVFLLSTHMLTPWPSLPHGLNWHQSEPNPIKHFPKLDASSMVHSHSFSFSSSCWAADQSRPRNKGGSISEIQTLSSSCSPVVQQKPSPPNSRRLDEKCHLNNDTLLVVLAAPVVAIPGQTSPMLCFPGMLISVHSKGY